MELWILLLASFVNDLDSGHCFTISSGNDMASGYFYWPLVAVVLDTFTGLKWQLYELWILLLNCSGNDTDSGYEF